MCTLYLVIVPGLCQKSSLQTQIRQVLLQPAEDSFPVVATLHVQPHEVLPLEGGTEQGEPLPGALPGRLDSLALQDPEERGDKVLHVGDHGLPVLLLLPRVLEEPGLLVSGPLGSPGRSIGRLLGLLRVGQPAVSLAIGGDPVPHLPVRGGPLLVRVARLGVGQAVDYTPGIGLLHKEVRPSRRAFY